MRKQHPRRKRRAPPKAVLRLPDLDQAKSAVLNSLTSVDAKRGYRQCHRRVRGWYCSEPRLSFNRTVVLRCRMHLESRKLAPGTINLRLGAVRRLAYEASDSGLLSADLAAGIRRVKGVKKSEFDSAIGFFRSRQWHCLRPRSGNHERQTGSGAARHFGRLRFASARGRRIERLGSAATRGPLGDCGLDRQSFSHSDHPSAVLGQGSDRRVVGVSRDLEWKDLQEGDTCRHCMGKRAERKGRLAPGQALCEKSQHRETRSTRSPPNLRPALPSGRRRTGSDSVSAWTCIGTDNRAIPWLQAADPQRCQ
jgi:hypothetical protein